MKIEFLYKTHGTAKLASHNIETTNELIVDSYSKNKKLIRKDYDHLKRIIVQINLDKEHIGTENASRKDNINIPAFGIENDFFVTELTTGVYE